LDGVFCGSAADGGSKTLSRVYNYGLQPISQKTGATTYYFIQDGHGSTRELTDTSGVVAQWFVFDAYGTLVASNAAPATPLLYCGEYFDSNLGQYYLRARILNQGLGRFTTMDTYEGNQEDPLSLHKYGYGADNPVNNVDPSGHDLISLSISTSIGAVWNQCITPLISWHS
jgi:RHS repeat-associated protein